MEEPIDPALYSPIKLGDTSHESVGTMATVIGWGNTVFSGSNYAAYEIYKEFMDLSNGNYRFSMFDSGGDGTEKVTLRDDNKALIYKGINFGSQAHTDFCIAN